MKLVQLCNEFPPTSHGGIGSLAFDLADPLAERCEEFKVIGIYPPAVLRSANLARLDGEHGYPVLRIANPFCRFPTAVNFWLERWWLYRALRRLYRRHPWDLLLCDDYTGVLPWGAPCGSPFVVRLNGSHWVYDRLLERPSMGAMHLAEKRTLSRANAWIGVSKFILTETERQFDPPSNHMAEVLPNGIDCSRFLPDPGVRTVPYRIVFHNSMRPRKGVFDLVRAMRQVFPAVPGAELHLIGGAVDLAGVGAELRSELAPRFHHRVHIHGRMERGADLIRMIQSAHVACYPSHVETFGLAPVEAMALGRVTIYSSSGPGPEIIESGVDGFLCPPQDPIQLGETILRAFRLNEVERTEMGRRARAKVLRLFDRSAVVDRYMPFLQAVAAGGKRSRPRQVHAGETP